MSEVQPFPFEPTYPLAKNQSIWRKKVSQVIQINEMREEESAAPNGALVKSARQWQRAYGKAGIRNPEPEPEPELKLRPG